MSPTRTLLLCGSLALFANVIPTQQALAVALRPNKTTDDSVCDLTHHTNLYLGSKTLVPSVAQTKDKVDAYFRLAGEFVAGKCKNGQLLMVRGTRQATSIFGPSRNWQIHRARSQLYREPR